MSRLHPQQSLGIRGLVSHAARKALRNESAPPRTAVQHSIRAFENAVGGRQALIEALSASDASEEIQQVLNIIADPRYDTWDLARICHRAQITPGQLFQAFKHAALARAQVLAIVETANQLPGIVKELLAEAINHTTVCTGCNGVGTVTDEPTRRAPNPSPRPCTTCNGLGTLHVAADLERQKIALELANLLKKAGGIAVNTQVNVQQPALTHKGGSLEQLQQAVGEILYGEGGAATSDLPPEDEILDAEVNPDLPPESPA